MEPADIAYPRSELQHAKVSCRGEAFQHFPHHGLAGSSVLRAVKEPEMATNFFAERLSAPSILKTAAFVATIGLVSTPAVVARGGGGHGMGFGLRGGGMGRGERMMAPAYVLITVASVSDAEVFKRAIQHMTTAAVSFAGSVVVDAEKPPAWEGAAAERVMMVRFEDSAQAEALKNSDAFKSVDADLRKSSASTMQLVQGLPMPEGRGGRGGRRLDAKAFEPNVQEYDRLLDRQLKTICKGC
jgi:uncharacterized protein (DUF1330 family)